MRPIAEPYHDVVNLLCSLGRYAERRNNALLELYRSLALVSP